MHRVFASLLLVPVVALALALPASAKKPIRVTWLGHAAFEVVSPGGTTLLIDPFLTQNPATPAERKDLAQYKPDAILVTHSHGDHEGDAVALAKATKAKVVGAHDHVRKLEIPEEQKLGGNVGGAVAVGDVTVHFVPAMHGSTPGGRPLGFVVRFSDGRSLYHSGDTWIFGDMALIHDLYKPEILLMNAGGGPYTQDPTTAALAVKKFFKPKVVVPMHFGTFPPLATKEDVEKAFGKDKRVRVLEIGKAYDF